MTTNDLVQRILLRSGTTWVLWALGALSVASAAVIVERWFFLRSRDCDPRALAGGEPVAGAAGLDAGAAGAPCS